MLKLYYQKLVLLIIFVVSIGLSTQAQNYTYSENSQKDGFNIQSSTKGVIVLEHAIHQFRLTDTKIQGEVMKQLNYDLSILPSQEGAPNVPSLGRYLLIPNGADIKIKVLNEQIETYQNIEIAPAAAIPFDTQEAQAAEKGNVYQKDAFFPGKVYQSDITQVRGMTLAMVDINPFQYNPVTKELRVYKNIQLEIEILGGNGSYGEDRFRSRYWDGILDDLILNNKEIPKVDYSKNITNGKDVTGCEYLVIVPNNPDFISWADSIKLFRTEQGIQTEIVTTEEIGGNTLSNIKSFMNTVYETWDPVPAGVLLMADYGNDANTITSKTYPHPYSGNYITDNYFADYTGNDLPDFVFARMTGRNYAEFETMVKKFIDYERTPPLSEDFYNKPITALGWQTERWFQICSEAVGGYMSNVLGKETVRINAVYGGNPNSDPWSTATNTSTVVDYFGPNGQAYIPASPSELGGWNGGTAGDVVNALNDGAFILQHRDHGSEGGWGEPSFGMSNISQLNNVGELSHIFSINCLTGRFDVSGECFAEKFHRYTNGGALSLTAASQVSYSFVNDAFVWGMYDNMWPDFLPDYGGTEIPEREFRPAFGMSAGKYFLAYTNWPYNADNKQITYRLFHHHGDAFGIVYTEVPQEMTIDYADVVISGPDNIEVQAEEGAMIAFSVDGELIGLGEGTGSVTMVNCIPQDPGTIIKVVITKQNYFRHEGYIQVIAPDGPYIVKSGFDIDDSAGNNNNLVDFGEEILLDFSIKNLGTEIASNINVTISCNDEFVTLIDAEESYGDVDVDEELTHEGAFAFIMADSIPDSHNIIFSYTATNGDDVWESSFNIKAYAPVLEIQSMNIIEVDGNGNGRVDAGEDALISIEISNNGRCASPEGLASLVSESEYLIINTSEFVFETIDSAGTIIAEFSVSTADETPTGAVVSVLNNAEAELYSNTKEFHFSVGLIVEDWETGGFEQFDWQNSGNSNWIIDNTTQYEGDNSAKSGSINDNQSSSFFLSYDVMVDDDISFFYKVSSESGYDKLKFFIDNDEKGSWSGEVAWSEASFSVSAGQHIFKWTYSKDGSVSSGSDCAWVDFIILPPMLLPTANAGVDAEICQTETEFQVVASAADFESLEWATSGDGSFSATDIENPIYSIGSEDISNGSVQLTLTAYGSNGDASNSMILSLVTNPVKPETPFGETTVCYAAEDVVYTINDDNEHYQWFMIPEDAGTISVIANTAYITFNDGFIGEVSLSALAYNACGESTVSDELVLEVTEQASAAFIEDVDACSGTDAVLNLDLAGIAPWTVEIMDEDGAEIIFTADVSPYDLIISPEESMTYTLMHVSDANNCVGLAEGSAMVTINELPTAVLTAEDMDLCGGDIIDVSLDCTGTAPWDISLGNGDDVEQNYHLITANELVEFIVPMLSMNLQITSLRDANECIGSGEGMAALNILDTPEVDLGADTAICHNWVYILDAQNEGATYSWSTGEESQTIEVDLSMADANGDAIISVDVINPNGCLGSDEVLVHFNDCTGIRELDAQNIDLMPNPNTGRFILKIPQLYNQINDVDVLNSLGEIVSHIDIDRLQSETSIDLSYLANGVYFLRIKTFGNTINKRFIIRK